MNVLSRMYLKFKNMVSATTSDTADMQDERLLEWLGISQVSKQLVSEVTYFTCLKMLSETLGKMPVKFYQETEKGIEKAASNEAHRLLKLRPNPFMTPSTFWAAVEQNRNHYGNGYVWLRKVFNAQTFGGTYDIKDMWVMPSDSVQVYIDDAGLLGETGEVWYVYTDKYSGEQYTLRSNEVMHFKTSYSFDGILGVPVKDILKSTVEGGLESQNFMNNLYKSGLTAKAVLEYTGDLDQTAKERLVAGFEAFANGSENSGKIIPVPLGMKLTPLNIKLTDSQFFELKKFSALQIASAFGIKPNQINDYEKSSYANSEMQQLSFYVDTELFILKQYEEEINYKILTPGESDQGLFYKFNEKAILRTDSKTQMEILTKAVDSGIYNRDEARETLNMPRVEGGDILTVNGNVIPVTMAGQQYIKGGE
ncbi:phage portal protein [Priestia aryabhattai]|uniref:phage portal protein n=1 Tax=Priestia aryabhattai TaxID=412384 RepID=UPI0023B00813|nr:phage portal protein [Priestia aryabhattai]MDE8676460.1 phage portal protein [Priestia aryabhattai]